METYDLAAERHKLNIGNAKLAVKLLIKLFSASRPRLFV
jgi:hypothetical protein